MNAEVFIDTNVLLYTIDEDPASACEGVVSIDFHREGESLEAAIRSAIADVQKAGCTVAQVTLEADSLAALS
jgi:predicted nucleic acid-binding protein